MEHRKNGPLPAALSVGLGLSVLVSPVLVSSIREWVLQTWALDSSAFVRCIFFLQAVAAVHVLAGGTTWARGSSALMAVMALPVFAPLAAGLIGVAVDYFSMHSDALMFPDLEHRLLVSIRAVEYDRRRILGLLGTASLASAAAFLAVFRASAGANSSTAVSRGGSVATWLAVVAGLSGGLLWYVWLHVWPIRFEWLVLGTLTLAALVSLRMWFLRLNHVRCFVAFFLSQASLLLCYAEYAARRTQILDQLPTNLPFALSAKSGKEFADFACPSWIPALVFPSLTLAILGVPLLFADGSVAQERRSRRQFIVKIVVSLLSTAMLVGALGVVMARHLAEVSAPLERFRRIADLEPPAGYSSAMNDGQSMIVTRDARLLLDGNGSAATAPLLAADRRLTLDRLWRALPSARRESRIETYLVVGPALPTMGPSCCGIADTFSGELGVRAVLLASRSSDVADWLKARDRRGLVVLPDAGSARCFFLENPRIQAVLPMSRSASDEARRRELFDDFSSSEGPPPRLVILAPRIDQSIDEIVSTVDAVERLRVAKITSTATWAFILTPDRAAMEESWNSVAHRDP